MKNIQEEDIQITDKEYTMLTQKLKFFDTTRNSLLTFSFTSVLAVLGIALNMEEVNTINVWICIVPFFLIIPFSARISYYRLATAHINSFLKKFANRDMIFTVGADTVKEDKCKYYKWVAWLVNHEMAILGMATSFIFYMKYIPLIKNLTIKEFVFLCIPIILNIIVYVISDSAYDYSGIENKFSEEWNQYIQN